MQGISIFQQIYAPRVAHVVTGFDGVSHNTHSPYAMGGVVGSVGKMTAIVANDQADTWHIVNLKCGKIFDAVAVLGAFDESEAANMAMRYHGQYFDAVCGDVCESNTGGLQRFLNHPVYMRTNRPVYAEELAKLQDVPSTQAILWDGVQLKSHNGSSKHLLLDMMRCDDDKALLEKMDFVEEESQLDGEIAEYDALVVEAYKLESTVSKLALAMDKATSISTLKVANQTLSKPKTMRGFGVIQQLVLFELSDGQAVSIIFNVSDSEANASAKMTKDDLLVAWKYKLNSRDITAAVQPNATQNVSLNMIASRIMGLADANSEKFVAAQKKKDAMQTELANTNQRVKDLQGQEQALLQEIADLQKQLDEKAKNNKALEAQKAEKEANKVKTPTGEELQQQGYNGVISELKKLGWTDDAVTGGLSKSFVGAKESGSVNPEGVLTVAVTSKVGNMMAIVGDAIVRNSVVTIPQYGLTAQTEESYKKEAEKINKAVNFYIDDVRPFIRGELLQDVFVVKKGGVYNSDLEMNNLNYSIKVFLPRGFEKDLKENMTVKATISREYKHDWRLKSVDEIIDDPLKQQREIQEAEYQKSVGYNQLKFIKDNADSLLYEMDAKKTDSITTIEGFGQKTTVTRQQVMDVIKERMPKPVQTPVVPTPTPAAKSKDLTDEEYAALKKAYDEFNAKTDKIGAAKSREDALKIATDLVTEMPEKEYQIRRAFSDAIRNNKWYGFEINFPKQPVKVKTDAELNRTLNRLQKALEGTAYSVNGKFNYGSAKLKLAYSNGGSSWGNKYADKTIDQIKGKFVVIHDVYAKDAIEWMKPLVDGMLSWLNGETVPKMFLGNDLKWDTQIGTPRVIDDAFKEAKAKAAPVAQPNNTLQKDISKSELFKDANVWAIDDFGKENGMVIYSRDEQDGFSIGIVDKLKQVNMQYTDIDTDQQTNESFSTENITNEQVIEKIKMFIAKHEQKSVNRFGELSSLLSSDGWTLTGIEPKEDGDILATKPFSTERKGQKINATFSLRYKSSGDYFQGYVDEIGDTNNHKSAIESSLMLVDDAEGKVKAISENLAMFAIRNSAKTEPAQPVSEPQMTNPDRDYLQSIIDGEVDLSNADEIEAKLTDISERLDAELEPMFEQAAEAFAQYAIAQAATV